GQQRGGSIAAGREELGVGALAVRFPGQQVDQAVGPFVQFGGHGSGAGSGRDHGFGAVLLGQRFSPGPGDLLGGPRRGGGHLVGRGAEQQAAGGFRGRIAGREQRGSAVWRDHRLPLQQRRTAQQFALSDGVMQRDAL